MFQVIEPPTESRNFHQPSIIGIGSLGQSSTTRHRPEFNLNASLTLFSSSTDKRN
ncbi:hypothetical protein BDN70DRAFT_885596 [Pholiota conissans]|uniref:Uncharacterized protein n=1 Tax=Pholiota conissans TaxID=109636 RepID=A0A9P5YS93_9AGAR|nr:hypothetical protein BDN70DRAFT_885596 [Pholiota conissans]